MPMLSNLADTEHWANPDKIDRPIVAYGAVMREVSALEIRPHAHSKGQIILVQRGALTCEVEGGLWIVPPRSAIWIPGGAVHAIRGSGLEGYNGFIAPDLTSDLPTRCCAVAVKPLLRELLIRSAALPLAYEETGATSRMVGVLLDEIATARVENLHLPTPTNPRLRGVMEEILASPGDRRPAKVWAQRLGTSERTFARMVTREMGMSFDRWRRQLSALLAVKLLSEGAPVQRVSAELGYESTPSFVTMFKRTLGASPRRYMAERRSSAS